MSAVRCRVRKWDLATDGSGRPRRHRSRQVGRADGLDGLAVFARDEQVSVYGVADRLVVVGNSATGIDQGFYAAHSWVNLPRTGLRRIRSARTGSGITFGSSPGAGLQTHSVALVTAAGVVARDVRDQGSRADVDA